MDELILRKKLCDLALELDGSPPYETRAVSLSRGEMISIIRALELVSTLRAVLK